MPRSVVQSFKKVINEAPTSRPAATTIGRTASVGTDSVAAGQTSATDTAVPTGSVIKYIEFHYSFVNLVNVASFMHLCIQLLHSGQTAVAPNVVGGSPQRNQVFWQAQRCLGQTQNGNMVIRFKIPPKYQRVREGDSWQLTRTCDTVFSDSCQLIYKFYR